MSTSSRSANPPLDVLRNQAFPELAVALRSRSTRILERWEASVRDVLPAAEELTLAQLRNSVPLVIDQMIEALEVDEPEPTDRLMEISKPHGETRFHQDYNVNELLIEYHLLRRICIEETTEQLARDLTPDETVALNLGIDTAQRRGVVTFVSHLGKQLTNADELQAHYISFLNHDLRGGMNGILLMVEVLKRELGGEERFAEAADDLETMRRAVLESVATMDRFVFAHRLGRGKYQAKPAPIGLRTLINDVMTNLISAAKERGVQFSLEVNEACTLTSDRDMLRFILLNVIANTVKHARRGGGGAEQVQISVQPRAEGGCSFTVSDDGPGIPPDQLKGVFDLAFMPSGGKTKNGVRLGLPVSKMAAELIGAQLTVESIVGTGTTVRLEVPDRLPA
jgi:signal transduction histidine kinase